MEDVNLSVVIPTYRRPELLRRCLDAIIQQVFPGCNFEIIVVSDGPDEKTQILIDTLKHEYENFRLRFFSLSKNSGPSAARNFGWRNSAGEFIVFTDDDCIPAPSWLKEHWKAYQSGGNSIIAFTGQVQVPCPEKPTDYQKNVSHLSTAEFVTANCACSKNALMLVGGFDEDFPTAWREDSDLHFKLLEKNIAIIKNKNAVVCHPARKASWGVSIAEQRKSMFNALLFKKHPQLYRSKIAAKPQWNYYMIICASIAACWALFLNNHLLAYISIAIWLSGILNFAASRLKGTDVSISHRAEMLVTSVVIPYLSVYWTIRGSLRYSVFFL